MRRDSPERITIVERDFRELDELHQDRVDRDARGDRRKLWKLFAACDSLLAPDGLACIQAILVLDERFSRYRASPDWIERHIFPGCLIPSRAAIRRALEPTRLGVVADTEIGGDYGETLAPGASASARISTRCERSATTSASSARGTSTSPRARRSSAPA